MRAQVVCSMILNEGRQAVITFIDYSAVFYTESQLFLDEALADAGVPSKVRLIIQAISSQLRQGWCVSDSPMER